MLKKIYAAILVAITAGNFAIAQSGTLKGKAIDDSNNEGISFANIQLEQEGSVIAKTIADIDGNFTIKPIPPGKYDLKTAAVGYQTLVMKGVIIGGDKTTYQDMKVKTTAQEIKTFEFVEYSEPLIDPDTKSGGTVTREEFQAMPSKNINSVAATTAGVFQRDEGDALNIRGARSAGTDYYIDGEKVRGTTGLPQSSIEQISVITGGIPSQYGDATGGFVNITTRGGMRNEFFGGFELISSQLTDAYDYNFAGFNVGGPLMSKKDTTGSKQAKLGFFLSGEVSSDKDPDPSAVGIYKVKDEKLKELQESPLSVSETGGTKLNAEYLRFSDLERIKARQNVQKRSTKLAGKIDFKATDDITFTLGGSMDYANYYGYDHNNSYVYDYALLNPSNNPQTIYNTKRIYGKITHKLGKQQSKEDKSTSLIQNAYYSLQVGYTSYKETLQDDSHLDNVFNYGYIGKFNTYKAPVFSAVKNSAGTTIYYEQSALPGDTLVNFDATNSPNPEGALYTTQYYDLVAGDPNTLTDIQSGLGLLNGDRPKSPYNLWFNTGRQFNRFHKIDQRQLRIAGIFSSDVKSHAIQAGFEYEKREDRLWSIAPITLWTYMRQYANKHLSQLNFADTLLYDPDYNGTGLPAYAHPYLVSATDQTQFDKSLRKELGLADDVWIDIDSYDPSTYSLSMFSPDELLKPGLVSYYGYSYDGKTKTKTTFGLTALENFYKEKHGANYARVIPSFQPIYMAGYIQDKFDIKDVKFNIGLRIDRFDANQPVLKDKYLFHEAYTVSEATKFTHPANVGADYVVYVDNFENPTKVLGYRKGDQWYNANGITISDPSIVATTKGIQPYLKYPKEQNLFDSSDVAKVFKMYDPQLTFMPRIAFAFPISDRANFFAHYDVLTQRPSGYLRFSPTNYTPQDAGGRFNNPGLKPERTTDYEAGFTQVLNERKNSALTLSVFYREMRDMIQIINVYQAYPVTYTSYGNIDFGTAKGVTVAYDLRRTSNVQMTASYTLQFADGTGSAAETAKNIIGDQPNLRTTMPLDFDQRHAIVINADYRFGSGKEYRGPNAKWAKMIFEDFGGNMVLRAGSGLPYSRQSNVSSGNGNGGNQIIFNQNDRTSLKGKINGSNLPWQNRVDLRLDKNIQLTFKKGEGEDKGKTSNLNVYLVVMNVLNAKNVLNLYRYTGDPTDDGYLAASPTVIDSKNDPQSFTDLYNAKVANPSFFSIPRRIRIGLVLDF